MSRFGPLYASFYARDNLATPLVDINGVNYRVPISGRGKWVRNAAGEGEALLALDAALLSICYAGVVCALYQHDNVLDIDIAIAPAFIVKNVEPMAMASGDQVRISGPGQIDELKDLVLFAPIGEVTLHSTVIAAVVPGPSSTTIKDGKDAAANARRIYVTSLDDFAEGDQVTVELDDGSDFVTLVEMVKPEDEDYALEIRDRLPGAAAAGNVVSRKARRVKVEYGVEHFQVGCEVYISDPEEPEFLLFYSIVDDAPEDDVVTLRDALTLELEQGWEMFSIDRTQPTTEDVTAIMSQATSDAYLPGAWTISFETGTGTQSGTHHAPSGDSIYDLLVATAEQSGEFFRPHNYTDGHPSRTLVWRRSSDNSIVRLVNPTPDKVSHSTDGILDDTTGEVRGDRALITGELTREGTWSLVTRVYPFAGDDRVSISKATAAVKVLAAAHGYTIVDESGAWGSLYAKPYLKSGSRETSYDVVARTETWSDIRVKTDNPAEIVSASDQLLHRAIAYLDERSGPRYTYQISGVIAARPILPGNRVELIYSDPAGAWSLTKTAGDALYCVEVENVVDAIGMDGDTATGGYRVVNLVLSDDKYGRPTPERSAAKALVTSQRLAREGGGAADRAGGGGLVVMGGGAAPNTVSATSPNAVGPSGQTHAVQATANGKIGPGQLLKTTSGGQLTVAGAKADYIYLADADGEIGGARGSVRFHRRVYDGMTFLVAEALQ